MLLQRACGGEMQAEIQAVEYGSLRARRKAPGDPCRVFRDVKAYVSCQEYVGIPQRAQPAKQGGIADDRIHSSLTDPERICQGLFLSAAPAPPDCAGVFQKGDRLMKITPSQEEIRRLAGIGEYDVAPVMGEILSDVATPVQVMRILMNVSAHCFMLESAEDNEQWGRYSFLGFEPKRALCCADGTLKIDDVTIEQADPRKYIRQILQKNRAPKIPGMPPFTGGLVGYFSYDYLKYSEPTLRLDAEDTEGFQDVDLMLFDRVICFDNYRQKILLIVNMPLGEDLKASYNKAVLEIRHLRELILTGTPKKDISGRMTSEIRPFFTREQYCEMVEKAKHGIREGDIFQIVLSNRLEADFQGSLFPAYRVLRTLNPSPYMLYFSGSDMEVAGSSPETLVKLQDGTLHTFPLAGTRPRGKTKEEDDRLEKELLEDPKELAEHNMLVDLGRNDIGKLSRFGTVEVERYHTIQKYSHVMHIGSTIRGEIRDDRDALDAIDAVLPAGTLSGAPKLRACQMINDLEQNKRGIYGGAIGYIDFTGNLDCCIAIRIAYKKNNKVFIRSGAGIVSDSVPEKEYQECLNKAAAVVTALKEAEEEEE
ncbi:anthranilate synthase, component I [Eubacterium pyruvativorans]|uniref:Anthranilate synthase component 1 n=2 Tax=Eubacterium pyruvativorans TaxID=155865 RepID=A0A1I7GXP2_9FIRM|nr:anthranilate synthase, component I [Eubacterium pyruvativorans]SFU53217.1 anthranilate synthase, component I [Eubacterium pyruvativorans]